MKTISTEQRKWLIWQKNKFSAKSYQTYKNNNTCKEIFLKSKPNKISCETKKY